MRELLGTNDLLNEQSSIFLEGLRLRTVFVCLPFFSTNINSYLHKYYIEHFSKHDLSSSVKVFFSIFTDDH